jgi:hypothetical protein
MTRSLHNALHTVAPTRPTSPGPDVVNTHFSLIPSLSMKTSDLIRALGNGVLLMLYRRRAVRKYSASAMG